MYKVEIIGDAITVFLESHSQKDHAARAAYSALKMLEAIEEMKREDKKLKEADVKIRIGIHSDKVVRSCRYKRPRYHLFGTTPQIGIL